MNIFTQKVYFEQHAYAELPHKAVRIVRSCASRAMSGMVDARSQELAEALLLMKLYQAYGYSSRNYTKAALELLHDLLNGVRQGSDIMSRQPLAQPS